LERDATAKLAFELVALRGIQPGEEVLLDYGEEWEQAWNDHVSRWNPLAGSNRYVSAFQLNNPSDDERQIPLRTVLQQATDPYPPNVDILYNPAFSNGTLWREARSRKEGLRKWDDGTLVPCDILRYRYDEQMNEILYTVVFEAPGQENDADDSRTAAGRSEEVPREAIQFRDRPYTTDMFMENTFRHDIPIPDALFPSAWENRKTVNANLSELDNTTQSVFVNPPDLQCGIWLAPSTIPGAGLGMYAGRDFAAHEVLQTTHTGDPTGEVVVPIYDIVEHNREKFSFLWDEYTWSYVSCC
jgi:hypothetical protein